MTEEKYDAIVVGAGFSGIHQLIHLRKLGLSCKIIETGSELGGTWHWNTYPGARVDSAVPIYELSLPELWKSWTWTEKFPGWKELQAYFAYVGDKCDIRKHCRFDSTVKQAHWDNRLHLWHITADGKDGLYKASARYLIMCTGVSSTPYVPNIKGLETFKGPCSHTGRWPKEGIETAGQRVGVIGTGASGVQVIQEVGPQAERLTVFQRTPNLALPMGQLALNKQIQDHFKFVYEDLYKKLCTTATGFPIEGIMRPMASDTEKERRTNFEALWGLGGFHFIVGNYLDLFVNKTTNDEAYAFWREKVRKRVEDPKKQELLAPMVAPHPLGCKRASLEQNFYEICNQDNVDIVDIKATPILEITPTGLKTAEKEYEFDVLVLATGYDNYVGGFTQIDLRGLDGRTIQDHWKDGVRTYLGLTIDDFPNLFFIYGPQGPTALCNGPTCVQLQGSWIVSTIDYLWKNHITKFTPTYHAASTYKKLVDELCAATLLPQADSWIMGANIPGKKREAYNYLGGVGRYGEEIMEEIRGGYPGFQRESLEIFKL